MSRICLQVQSQLPGMLDESLPRWRLRLVRAHLKRCEVCQAERDRQRDVVAGLHRLEEVATATAQPPEGLLDALLQQAERRGARGRVAVPARGAVSGARPVLSVVFLLAGALAGTAAGYAGWRAATAIRHLLTSRRR